MHNDGSMAKYLASDSLAGSLSDPTGFGKYLPGYEATEPENGLESRNGDGSMAKYLRDSKH